MFQVTIYLIETNEDEYLGTSFYLGDPMRCLIVPSVAAPEHELIAAEGWAKSLGIYRRDLLKTKFNAPAQILERCTCAQSILDNQELSPAPRFLWPEYERETTHWILDNSVESWLISVKCPDIAPAESASALSER